ncbi:hypothetical protein O6H91_23G006300 [Diphasiastrum complanatum]|uniref:Uncharacterized protein n=1 Tax=Diphasiastrum complanatum TaxID=34168 RepID=A0ACC2A7R2_DIPCM|nr:hypothetical protein O6H91_23G006300 [Diphasiastrum complanatum]
MARIESIHSPPQCSDAASSSASFIQSPAAAQGELQESLASLGLAVSISEEKGRCLIALRDFCRGQVILEQDPYVSVLDKESRGARCDSCFVQAKSLKRCSACKHVWYCSSTCQKKEWKLHQDECKAINEVKRRKDQTPTSSMQLMLRLMFKRKLQLDKVVIRSAMDNHEIVELLPTHMADTSEERLVLYAQMANLVAWIAGAATVDIKEVTQLFCRFACNAHTICDEELRPLGMGLFPVVSIINHSCEPNTVLLFEGKRAVVRALEQINVGSELTLSYIELGTSTESRRKALREQYYFTCNCPRCNHLGTGVVSLEDSILEGLLCKNKACKGHLISNKGSQKGLLCQLCGALVNENEASKILAEAKEVLRQASELASSGNHHSAARIKTEELKHLQEKLWHPSSVHLMWTHDNLLKICMSEQDWQSALDYCRLTIPAYERIYPQFHPLLGLQFFALGKLEWYLGNTVEAIKALTTARDILAVTHGSHGNFFQGLLSTLHDAQASLAQKRMFH